jgi:hypothetical protein
VTVYPIGAAIASVVTLNAGMKHKALGMQKYCIQTNSALSLLNNELQHCSMRMISISSSTSHNSLSFSETEVLADLAIANQIGHYYYSHSISSYLATVTA